MSGSVYMNRKRSNGMKRFMTSAVIAAPITVVLLFLMMRLILPGENDIVVRQMIQRIEFQRSEVALGRKSLDEIAMPSFVDSDAHSMVPLRPSVRAEPTRYRELGSTQRAGIERPSRAIDWSAAVKELLKETDENELDRWLLAQRHEEYVSVMQGPLPITKSVGEPQPTTQEDITGYLNVYGDMEIKVTKNCVARTQVAARHDISDFGKQLVMPISCKKPPAVVYSFER